MRLVHLSFFGNTVVFQKVINATKEYNGIILWNTTLEDCRYSKTDDKGITYDVTSPLDLHELCKSLYCNDNSVVGSRKSFHGKCECLVTAYDHAIDSKLLGEVIRTGLVFDSRIVVDSSYRTNDHFIYAFGAAVKFSKKYRQGIFHGFL